MCLQLFLFRSDGKATARKYRTPPHPTPPHPTPPLGAPMALLSIDLLQQDNK
jgi:hypothetical protein